jgi:hypothetical protein
MIPVRRHLRSILGAISLASITLLAAAAAALADSGPGPFPH